jgi:rhodanese-related sulfurtransferase
MNRLHRTLAVAAATLGCAAVVAGRKPAIDPSVLASEIDQETDHISALELAEQIMRADPTLRVFDLRSAADFDDFHIPTSQRATISDLTHETLPLNSKIVLYSAGGAHAAQAWVLLRLRGYRNVYFLREGMYEWNARVLEPQLAVDATASERTAFERAVPLSRFFGGKTHTGVARAELLPGYWTGAPNEGGPVVALAASVRRRGC